MGRECAGHGAKGCLLFQLAKHSTPFLVPERTQKGGPCAKRTLSSWRKKGNGTHTGLSLFFLQNKIGKHGALMPTHTNERPTA